jgi:hypothetical protein
MKHSKPRAYVPQTGAFTLTRAQFINMMRTRSIFSTYKQEVGLALATTALGDAFTESLRFTKPTGFWSPGVQPRVSTTPDLKFEDDTALATYVSMTEAFFEFDIRHIKGRRAYISGLKGKANGLLSTQLRAMAEPEGNYYAPRVPTVKTGRPVVPAKTGDVLNQSKALAWLTFGVKGDTAAYTANLLRMTKFDGNCPLGTTREPLFNAFQSLVPGAPAYRGWSNTATMQKYPSNLGGIKVLEEVLTDLAVTAMPTRGDARWYDLALYVFGSIMTVQAFTDGNKRMSRFAYVLMLLSGGVPMMVPNNVMGAQLGDML